MLRNDQMSTNPEKCGLLIDVREVKDFQQSIVKKDECQCSLKYSFRNGLNSRNHVA